jgi:hypothetical protein
VLGIEASLERVVKLLERRAQARVVLRHRRELREREIDALLRGEDLSRSTRCRAGGS